VGASLGRSAAVPQMLAASFRAYEDAVIALLGPASAGGGRPSLLAPTPTPDPTARLRPADTFGTFSLFGPGGDIADMGGHPTPPRVGSLGGSLGGSALPGHSMRMSQPHHETAAIPVPAHPT
jgi:hypothetical protein